MRYFALVIFSFVIICGNVEGLCRYEPDGTYLPDASSRQKFIYCLGGEMISGDCEPNEEFDPFERVCDVPRSNSQKNIQTTTPSRSLNPCYNEPDMTFLPNPLFQSSFFYCWNGKSIPGECDNGFVFDAIESFCRVITKEDLRRDPCYGKRDSTTFPDPTSKQHLILCVNGKSQRYLCHHGVFISHEGTFCDYGDKNYDYDYSDYPEFEEVSTTQAPRTTTRIPPTIRTLPTIRTPPPTRRTPPPTRRTPPPTRITTRVMQTTRPVPLPTRIPTPPMRTSTPRITTRVTRPLPTRS